MDSTADAMSSRMPLPDHSIHWLTRFASGTSANSAAGCCSRRPVVEDSLCGPLHDQKAQRRVHRAKQHACLQSQVAHLMELALPTPTMFPPLLLQLLCVSHNCIVFLKGAARPGG
jgi:hypothetical protein